jgi:subtilisin family serine protease
MTDTFGIRWVIPTAIALVLCTPAPASATDTSKTAAGANFAAAHARSTGAGVPIGIVESGARINAANNIGARLKASWNFQTALPSNQTPGDNTAAAGDNHMTLVADVAAGAASGAFLGVAPGADVYTGSRRAVNTTPANLAERDGDDPSHDAAYHSYRAAINWMYTPLGAPAPEYQRHPSISIFNNSWGAFVEQDDNGENRFARFVDYFARTRDVMFVGAAGNEADHADPTRHMINWPWDAYNGITVGATDAGFTARASYSQYYLAGDTGAAPDVRGKPDILAPGTDISDGTLTNSGTSFATPHVTGAVALLVQGTPTRPAGLPLGTMNGRNHLAIKAILLNSARKRYISGTNSTNDTALDGAGTSGEASDGDYLTIGGALRNNTTSAAEVAALRTTAGWTPAAWSTGNGTLTVTKPLDDEQGTGLLDVVRALDQYDGGEQGHSLVNQPGVTPIGWNREALAGDTAPHKYELNFGIGAGAFITATLVWDRVLVDSNGNDVVEDGDSYVNDTLGMGALPDFVLSIFKGNDLLAQSDSKADNLEHLHYPVPENGDPRDYRIEVDLLFSGDRFYDYGLAWFVPEPSTFLLLASGLLWLALKRARGVARAS